MDIKTNKKGQLTMNNRLNIGQYNGLKDRIKEIESLLNKESNLDLI